ncbi:MAG TPA: hypothetical protein VII43_05390, partial [Opitutaceae bacterium]
MSTHPGAELFLSRFAEGEWLGVVRPWLEGCAGSLGRSLVVAPTRGHTYALKRRCVAESLALLGVEFLTPGLARRKRGARADPGSSLHTLVLRARIEARLAPLGPEDPARLLWRSLASDLEVALGDFSELLRAGFRPVDFPHPQLRLVFAELVAWLEEHGYAFDPLEDESAGLRPPPPGTAPVADRILILAGGPEGRGEFFGLAALARRCPSLTVALAMPESKGAAAGEAWVDMWEKLLGVSHQVADVPEPALSCAAVAEIWSGEGSGHENAEIIVGRTRSDEMERVAERIAALLEEGAENIAVLFPRADAAHAHLVRILDAKGVVFADLVGSAGA